MASVPAPTRYLTTNGQPPNGGLVPSRGLFEVDDAEPEPASPPSTPPANQSQDISRPQGAATSTIPSVNHHGPGIALAAVPFPVITPLLPFAPQIFPPFIPVLHHLCLASYPSAPVPSLSRRDTGAHAVPTQSGASAPPMGHECTSGTHGHDCDPLKFTSDGRLHLFPEKFVAIKFLHQGDRPCDQHRPWTGPLALEKVRAPCQMKVKDLVRRLLQRACCTTGRRARAVQEMELQQRRPDGVVFKAGIVLSQQGGPCHWTLKELGWDNQRDDQHPVYLALSF